MEAWTVGQIFHKKFISAHHIFGGLLTLDDENLEYQDPLEGAKFSMDGVARQDPDNSTAEEEELGWF